LGKSDQELIYQSPEDKGPYYWSKDGSILFGGVGNDLYRLPLVGERKPSVALKSAFPIDLAAVSQDGRWVAYESNESVRMVQAGDRASFPLEALTRLGLGGDVFGQDLDSDHSIEPRVSGPVDRTHSARTECGDDFVRTQPGVRRERHNCSVQCTASPGWSGNGMNYRSGTLELLL
jgi:hypothetical protein